MKIFQFAVLLHPTDKQQEEGGTTTLIVPVTTILAPDQNGAVLQAGRSIPEVHLDKLDRIEVAVRPF